jgi:putative endonuclease
MDSNYKRMLKVMQEKEKKKKRKRGRPKKSGKPWLLYILKCADNSFYTGITNNLQRRLKMHANGKASRYTRTHGPVELLYQELCGSRTQAMVRECAVKALPRKKKEVLVARQDQAVI